MSLELRLLAAVVLVEGFDETQLGAQVDCFDGFAALTKQPPLDSGIEFTMRIICANTP